PVGVLAISAVLRPPRRLHIGGVPRLWTERAQRRRRMEGPRPHLHVIGLQDDAAPVCPEALKRQDQSLKRPSRIERSRPLPGGSIKFAHDSSHIFNEKSKSDRIGGVLGGQAEAPFTRLLNLAV